METVATVATVPAVIALCTIARDLGLPSRVTPVFALLCGVALQALQALSVEGSLTNWPEVIIQGIILGLGASGVYDGAKVVGKQANKPKHYKDLSI
nr:MAG TPA: holin [Caudoviricetes sp.]